jgi:hypothetical protein
MACLFGAKADAQSNARPVLHLQLFSPGAEVHAVRNAIEGAWRRLSQPDCQEILFDFSDGSGKPLAANLTMGRTVPEWLADLRFVEARHYGQCKTHDSVAFTQTGLRVVYLCGSFFANPLFSLRGTPGEVIVIHELLHTLGLPENPPSSEEITRQVTRRCGNPKRKGRGLSPALQRAGPEGPAYIVKPILKTFPSASTGMRAQAADCA